MDEQEVEISGQEWANLYKKAENNTWDFFEGYSSRDNLSAKEVAEFLKEGGFDSLLDRNLDYIDKVSSAIAKDIIEDYTDYSFRDVEDTYPEEVSELEGICSSNFNFNIGSIAPNELFLYSPKEIEIYEGQTRDVEDEEYDDSLDDLRAEAFACGFTEKDFNYVFDEAYYGGMGGVGIIVNGADIVECIKNGTNPKFSGTAIFYIRDSINGSGSYYISRKRIEISYHSLKEVLVCLDYGRYSLGDVFGTSDWTY